MNNKFSYNFEKEEKRFFRAFKLAIAFWIMWVMLCISALGALGYVAYHFISKYW